MIPTIYPTIFVDFKFGLNVLAQKYYKLKNSYKPGRYLTRTEAEHLLGTSDFESLKREYYPELFI